MKTLVAAAFLLSSSFANAQSQYGPCIVDVALSPKYAPLTGKVALGATAQQTFEMLANATIPTKQERELIGAWANDRIECFNRDAQARNAVPEIWRHLLEKQNSDVLAAIADLYNGKISYGQFAKQRGVIVSDFQAKWAAAKDQDDRDRQSRISAIQAQEEQRQQAALQMLMNRPQPQPYQMPTYQMPIPQNTNCYSAGNQINCTTR